MAAFLYDSFTHVPNTTVGLDTHTPETGGAWVQAGNKFAAQNFAVFIYAADYISSIATSPINCCYNNVMPPSEDVKVSFPARRGTNTSDTNVGLWLRCNPTAENAYRFVWDHLRVTVHRVNARAYTLIGQSANGTGIPFGPTPVNVEVKIVGGTITVHHNGVLVLNVTDGSPLANGYVGVGVASQGFIDEISAEDAAGGPAETLGSASGSSTVTGAGVTGKTTTGTTTGTVSSNMIAMKFQTGFGTIIGSAMVGGQIIEMITRDTTGVMLGGSGASGTGRAIFTGVGQSVGQSDAIGFVTGLTFGDTEANAAGQATITGFGSRVMQTTAFSFGESIVTGAAGAASEGEGTSEGSATMQGVARGFLPGETEGIIKAQAETVSFSTALKETTGSITSGSVMVGGAFTGSQGRSEGITTIIGVGRMIKATDASSVGQTIDNMIGIQVEGSLADTHGNGTANGVGHAIIEITGTAAGASDSYFLSFGVTAFITPADRTIEVPTENRAVIVLGEDRAIIVPRSDTSAPAELESRTIEVIAENRTIEVIAEDRSLTVNPENREIIL